MFEIQIDTPHGWSADQIGAGNRFKTEREAKAAIRHLKKLGTDWRKASYRVVKI